MTSTLNINANRWKNVGVLAKKIEVVNPSCEGRRQFVWVVSFPQF
ncbi:hypothetical protein [Iningainema tapete]|nr:hypothetical protein [Iningainema tapete]